MPSMDSLNTPEHDEFPFLLSMSNFAASAVLATSELPSFFEDEEYQTPPIKISAKMIEMGTFLFMIT